MDNAERLAQLQARKDELTKIVEGAQLDLQLYNLDEADDAVRLEEKERLEKVNSLQQRKDELTKMVESLQAGPAGPRVDNPDDTILDDALDVAGEAAVGLNRGVVELADFLQLPFKVGAEQITGREYSSISEMLTESLGDYAPGQGQFMDDGLAQQAVNAFGWTGSAAGGFKGVERGSNVLANAVLDIIGVGSSQQSYAAKVADLTQEALKADKYKLAKPRAEMNDDELFQEIQNIQVRKAIDINRAKFDDYEKVSARMEDVSEWDEATDSFDGIADELFDAEDLEIPSKRPKGDWDLPSMVTPKGFKYIQEELAEDGIDGQRVLDVINARGGLKFEHTMDDLIDMDVQLNKVIPRNVDGPGWFGNNLRPVADVVRKYAGDQVGNMYERAVETATRMGDQLANRLDGLQVVGKAVEANPQLKRMLLDVGRKPKLMPKIRKEILAMTGPKGLAVFDEYRRIADDQNRRALKSLFKGTVGEDGDGLFGEIHYFHTQTVPKPKTWKERIGRFGRPDRLSPSELRSKKRKPASKMTDAELAEYQNPIMTHFKHMQDQEQLLQIAEKFRLRPSMTKNSTTDDFFGELYKQLQREGLSESQAGVASDHINQAHMGSRLSPPPMIRAFMNTAYAGTLAQFKSATLNLHDVAISAVNNGEAATGKALFESLKGEFGKTMNDLGFSQQAVGEYMRGWEHMVNNPTKMDKFSNATHWFTDQAMRKSAFRYLDHYGKGVVIRASVNKMRDAAKNGNLYREFGELAYKTELEKIQPYLAKGMKVKDMPDEAAKIVEEIAFTALGKQQLISHAGRPLGYLRNPLLRPAYAMTGFAIKQQAMVAAAMGKAIRSGNYYEAGKFAAKYVAYAGLGYAGLNQGRSTVFKNEDDTFTTEDIVIDMISQVAAMATFNRIGDEYSMQQFLDNPYKLVAYSIVPPGGLVEAGLKDVVDGVKYLYDPRHNDPPDNLLQKFPAVGDFYKYYIKE